MDVPNRARYEAAAAKTMIVMVKRLRWLTPDALARLIEAGQFEQLIRAQAEVDERETTAARMVAGVTMTNHERIDG